MSIEGVEEPRHRDDQRADYVASAYEAYRDDPTGFCAKEMGFVASQNPYFSALYDSGFDGVPSLTVLLNNKYAQEGALFTHNVVRNALGERFQALDSETTVGYLTDQLALKDTLSTEQYIDTVHERILDVSEFDRELITVVNRLMGTGLSRHNQMQFWEGVVVSYFLLREKSGELMDQQQSSSFGEPKHKSPE
jgi:hypothetical protein